jgi:hypothetical protein
MHHIRNTTSSRVYIGYVEIEGFEERRKRKMSSVEGRESD